MKKFLSVFTAILILAAQAGCSHSTAGGGSAVSSRSVNSESASSQIGLKPGEAVKVGGEDSNFELHSIDFVDQSTGWIVQDRDGDDGSCRSQLLTTADGGKSWKKIGKSHSGKFSTLFFIGRKEGWAVACDTPDIMSQTRYQILHTSDGGANWSQQWKSCQETFADCSLWFRQDGTSGFALLGNRLLKTADSGKTWADVSFGIKNFFPERMSFTDAQTGWIAGANSGKSTVSVLRTADGGNSWALQFQRKNYREETAGCRGIHFLNRSEGWFLAAADAGKNSKEELYRTADGGRNWKAIHAFPRQDTAAASICFVDSGTGWIPLDFGGLAVTHDGGKSFQTVGASNRGDIRDTQKISGAKEIVFQTKQIGWAVGTNVDFGEYLLRTEDGGSTWKQCCPSPQPVADLSFVSAKLGYGLGERSDPNAVLKTADGGNSWEAVKSFTGESAAVRLSFISPAEGWILTASISSSSDKLTVLHTLDGGKTWNRTGEVPCGWGKVCYFRFFNAKNGIVAGEGESEILYRTADGGKTWKSTALKPPQNAAGQFEFLSSSDGWAVCNPIAADGTFGAVGLSRLASDGNSWGTPVTTAQKAETIALCRISARESMILAWNDSDEKNSRFELLTSSDGGTAWASHLMPSDMDSNAFSMTLGQSSIRNQCPMQFTDHAHGWILSVQGILATSDGGRSWSWK